MPDLHRRLSAPTVRPRARRPLGRAQATTAVPTTPRTVLAQLAAGLLCGLPLALLAQGAPEAAAPAGAPAMPAPPASAPLALRASPMLREALPSAARAQMPIFVTGDRITGQSDVQTVIEGNAELRRADTVLRANRLEYNVPDDLAKAQGQVRINREGNVYEGTALELYVNAFSGFFTDVNYRLLQNDTHNKK